MRLRAARPVALPCLVLLGLTACTGLAAGPEVGATAPVPAGRDSAYVRAKRALAAEVFTLDVQDSLAGRLTATRYPSATARPGTADACRVRLALVIGGTADQAEVASRSRWIAPQRTGATNPSVCDAERQATLARIEQVIAPSQQ